jgi:hypothetical protein
MASFLLRYDRCTCELNVTGFVGEHAFEEALIRGSQGSP